MKIHKQCKECFYYRNLGECAYFNKEEIEEMTDSSQCIRKLSEDMEENCNLIDLLFDKLKSIKGIKEGEDENLPK